MKRALLFRSVRRGSAAGWLLVILLAAVLGVGYYVYTDIKEKERLELEAKRKAREEAARNLLAEWTRQVGGWNQLLNEALVENIRLAREARRLEAERNRKKDEPVIVQREEPKEDPKPEEPKDPRVSIFEKPVTLAGIASGKTANLNLMAEVLNVACDTNEWELFTKFLEKNLKAMAAKSVRINSFDMDLYESSQLLPQAVAAYKLTKAISPVILAELNEKPEGGSESFLKYLLTNKDRSLINLMHASTGMETDDDWQRYLQTWQRLWQKSSPEFRAKYQSLAIACSIVNPDKLGGCETIGQKPMSLDEVYDRFCASAEAGRLKTDITRMDPADLIYVVNVRLPYSEMEWAQKHVNLSRKKWSGAYSMVKYLMERATQGVNPYKTYTLEEILKEGGVCRDQGYFAVNTARCNGIPAAYVTGDGNRGPHAWFVYMASDKGWQSAGGYGYTSGMTSNPQTGGRIHESLFGMRSDPRTSGARMTQMRNMLTMASLLKEFGMYEPASRLLAEARDMTPSHPLPWEASIAFMADRKPEPTPEQWKAMSDSIRKKFKKRPDFLAMADQLDEAYVRPHQDEETVAKELAKERRSLERSTGEGRADLSLQSLRRQIDNLVENEKLDDANNVFKKALRDYSERLDTLGGVMDMYWEFAREHAKYQKQAISAMERIYKFKVETRSGDYFKISKEVVIQKKIGNFYKESGDERKGDKILEKAEKRLSEAKDDA